MLAIGFPDLRYQLVAYVISALVCVIAGMLLANLTRFVCPPLMQWTVSGDLIVMVVLGGMGTLIGPVFGAAVLPECSRNRCRQVRPYWADRSCCPQLLLIGLFARGGIDGLQREVPPRLAAADASTDLSSASAACSRPTTSTST